MQLGSPTLNLSRWKVTTVYMYITRGQYSPSSVWSLFNLAFECQCRSLMQLHAYESMLEMPPQSKPDCSHHWIVFKTIRHAFQVLKQAVQSRKIPGTTPRSLDVHCAIPVVRTWNRHHLCLRILLQLSAPKSEYLHIIELLEMIWYIQSSSSLQL